MIKSVRSRQNRLKTISLLMFVNFLWPIARGYGRITGFRRLK
jgi:hypothetical protein